MGAKTRRTGGPDPIYMRVAGRGVLRGAGPTGRREVHHGPRGVGMIRTKPRVSRGRSCQRGDSRRTGDHARRIPQSLRAMGSSRGARDPEGYLFRTAMNVFRSRYRRATLAARRTLNLAPTAIDGLAAVEARHAVIATRGSPGGRRHPAVVYAALDGKSDLLRHYITDRSRGAAARISASRRPRTDPVGAYLSALAATSSRSSTGVRTSRSRRGPDSVMTQAPRPDACDAWKLAPRSPPSRHPFERRSDADPARRFDPFGAPRSCVRRSSGLSQTLGAIDRLLGGTHWPMRASRTSRTLWLADPTSPPDVSCVKKMPPLPFLIWS